MKKFEQICAKKCIKNFNFFKLQMTKTQFRPKQIFDVLGILDRGDGLLYETVLTSLQLSNISFCGSWKQGV